MACPQGWIFLGLVKCLYLNKLCIIVHLDGVYCGFFYPLFITILKQTYFFSAFPGMVCFWLTFYYITVNVGV